MNLKHELFQTFPPVDRNKHLGWITRLKKFLDVNDLSSTTVPSVLLASHSKITTCKKVTKAVGQGSTNQQNYTFFSHGFCLIVQILLQHCKT